MIGVGGVPEGFSRGDVHSEHPGPGDTRPARAAVEVRHGHVQRLSVHGHTEVHAALNAAATQFAPPAQRAAAAQIQGVDVPGLLTGEQHIPALAVAGDNRGRAKIEVRAVFGRAVDPRRGFTAHVPGIPRRHLPMPGDGPGIEAQGDDGVAEGVGRGGIILTGAHVEQTALGIDTRRVPHRRPGGGQAVRAHGVSAHG